MQAEAQAKLQKSPRQLGSLILAKEICALKEIQNFQRINPGQGDVALNEHIRGLEKICTNLNADGPGSESANES